MGIEHCSPELQSAADLFQGFPGLEKPTKNPNNIISFIFGQLGVGGSPTPQPQGALALDGRLQHSVHVKDTPNAEDSLLEHFDACCAFIHGALSDAGAVLVHCVAGRSRSAAVVCAYLLYKSQREGERALSPAEALRSLRQCRPWAKPNAGFTAQLHDYAALLNRADSATAAAAANALDEDIPWITVTNLRAQQQSDMRHSETPDERTQVACVTTDYAMQSVLLQMGLRLLSAEGTTFYTPVSMCVRLSTLLC